MEVAQVGYLEAAVEPGGHWLSRRVGIAIAVLSTTLMGFALYSGWHSPVDPLAQRMFVVIVIAILTFLVRPLGRKSWREKPGPAAIVDLAFIIGLIVYFAYIMHDFDGYMDRFGQPSGTDIAFGTFITIAVLEMGRRAIGIVLPALCVVVIVANLFAPYMPQPFYGSPISWARMVELVALQDYGIYNYITGVVATYLLLFFLFAALLQETGGGRTFLSLAMAVAGRFSGGPAKVAVLGSAMMGTMTGAPVANVVGTGSVTIPLMKSIGYRSEFAAAVEATASAGSGFVPPIMGTAAFIMAEALEVHYFVVAVAAIIPSLLYYLGIFLSVHFEAKKTGLVGLPQEKLPTLKNALRWGWSTFIPVGLLFAFLSRGYGLAACVLWAIISLAVMTQINPNTRWGPRVLLRSFERAANTAIIAGGAIFTVGILIGNFWVSGLGDTLAGLIVSASGGNLFVGLMITALVCLVLGMGMTSAAIYVTVLVIGVPALLKFGLDPLPAHFFAFFWGVMSTLTPPVCITVFAARAIANSKFWPTALNATKIGITAYIVAFAFVYSPELLAQGSAGEILLALARAALGVASLQMGFAGYFLGRLNWGQRLFFLVAGVALWVPLPTVYLAGAALSVATALFHIISVRSQQKAIIR